MSKDRVYFIIWIYNYWFMQRFINHIEIYYILVNISRKFKENIMFKIIIVEDNEDIRDVLVILLTIYSNNIYK